MKKRLLPEYSTKNLKCYAVNQTDAIKNISVRFTGAGHSRIYPQIPNGEIWISEELMKAFPPYKIPEGKYYIFHELYEHDKMARGMSYDDAHLLANQVEGKARKVDEKTLEQMIKREMLKNQGMIHEASIFNGNLHLHKEGARRRSFGRQHEEGRGLVTVR